MKERMEQYMQQKDAISRATPDYQAAVAKFKADYASALIRELGPTLPSIEAEHMRLTSAFGFTVGVAQTLHKPQPPSIVEMCVNLTSTLVSPAKVIRIGPWTSPRTGTKGRIPLQPIPSALPRFSKGTQFV